jgi:hypothetical protein
VSLTPSDLPETASTVNGIFHAAMKTPGLVPSFRWRPLIVVFTYLTRRFRGMNEQDKVLRWVAGVVAALMVAILLRRRGAKRRKTAGRAVEFRQKSLRRDMDRDEIDRLLAGLKELEERADDLEDMAGDLLEQARSALSKSGGRRDENGEDEDEDEEED